MGKHLNIEDELLKIRKEQFDIVPNDVPWYKRLWTRMVLFLNS